MDGRLKLLLGTGLGAISMYYLDPARGRYRRAMVRNRLTHAGREVERGMGVVAHDFWNRAAGMGAEVRAMFDSRLPDDTVLVERVRACLGRVVTHPASIDVSASDGVVTLEGLILADEVADLLGCARRVHGVKEVRNRLEAHATPGRIPGLQGEPPKRKSGVERSWTPAARTLYSAAGVAAALYGFRRRSAGGTLLGTLGVALLSRAATNLDLGRLLGVGSRRHTIEVQKSIRIRAPVEHVFELWEDFESFPRLMAHVRRVRLLDGDGDRRHWRWTVRGAAGIEMEFDTVVTAVEQNRLIAWRTEGTPAVRHSGTVRFHGNDDGSTTVELRMTYTPVGGALGDALARLIGADPKRQIDDDLLRLKTFMETGRAARDAAEPTGEFDEVPMPAVRPRAAAANGASPDIDRRMS